MTGVQTCAPPIFMLDSLGSLDETPKVTQLEDDRFNRMEHFYGSDEIDPESLEEFELGDDGKVTEERLSFTSHRTADLYSHSKGWLRSRRHVSYQS